VTIRWRPGRITEALEPNQISETINTQVQQFSRAIVAAPHKRIDARSAVPAHRQGDKGNQIKLFMELLIFNTLRWCTGQLRKFSSQSYCLQLLACNSRQLQVAVHYKMSNPRPQGHQTLQHTKSVKACAEPAMNTMRRACFILLALSALCLVAAQDDGSAQWVHTNRCTKPGMMRGGEACGPVGCAAASTCV
jgi:hypothetical protein